MAYFSPVFLCNPSFTIENAPDPSVSPIEYVVWKDSLGAQNTCPILLFFTAQELKQEGDDGVVGGCGTNRHLTTSKFANLYLL
mmetsp:Transcript_16331/g.23950  ORF Transcript_16331/g.23950 Transcript_16331/m.23950 type:complete len:83 (+) Transcript_16331:121-369(+)